MQLHSKRTLWQLLKSTTVHWYEDNAFLYGAALAYYTVFAIAPIVLVAVAFVSMVFGPEAAQGRIVREISQTVGPDVGKALEDILKQSNSTGGGPLMATVGVILLLIGATTVFAQLQEALNAIWKVKPKPDRGLWDVIRDRLLSFSIVLAIGFLLLVSLVFSTALNAISHHVAPESLPGGAMLWHALTELISFVGVTVLFALIYRILPDVNIDWSDVLVGALVTALLFTLGKYLIGIYLGQSGITSAYGAAGSLVLILMWVYYSSQVFLFGAEFTYVYSKYSGKPIEPSANAVPLVKSPLSATAEVTATH